MCRFMAIKKYKFNKEATFNKLKLLKESFEAQNGFAPSVEGEEYYDYSKYPPLFYMRPVPQKVLRLQDRYQLGGLDLALTVFMHIHLRDNRRLLTRFSQLGGIFTLEECYSLCKALRRGLDIKEKSPCLEERLGEFLTAFPAKGYDGLWVWEIFWTVSGIFRREELALEYALIIYLTQAWDVSIEIEKEKGLDVHFLVPGWEEVVDRYKKIPHFSPYTQVVSEVDIIWYKQKNSAPIKKHKKARKENLEDLYIPKILRV